MTKRRPAIPNDISAQVMFQHDRTCCVCRERGLSVQIHHIDEDPTNHAIDNLAVLCLEHHGQTQIRGGFAKRLKASDILIYRNDWVCRVQDYRNKADELIIKRLAAVSPEQKTIEEWAQPHDAELIGFLSALPSIRKAATAIVQSRASTHRSTSEMRRAAYEAIELLERTWLRLAKFYPPQHFGEMAADHFLSEFIGRRFEWHRKLYEPRGPGTSGTIVHLSAGGAVLDDIADTIAETVEGLRVGYSLSDFPIVQWRSDWDDANKPEAK